jgi:molybdopterin converting factor small subunit
VTHPSAGTDQTPKLDDPTGSPEIHVEFFGMARQLAGCESTSVNASTIADVIAVLSAQFPELAARCFVDRGLRQHWLFNIGGRFIRDTSVRVTPETPVLLMSADAGG